MGVHELCDETVTEAWSVPDTDTELHV